MNTLPPQPDLDAKPSPRGYMRDLAERRVQVEIGQCAGFGALIGCLLAGLGVVGWCAWPGPDWAWLSVSVMGLASIAAAFVCPQVLDGPTALWMRLARYQGWLIFSVLLSVVYLLLLIPIAWVHRRRHGRAPFHTWQPGDQAPPISSAWEPIQPAPRAQTGQGEDAIRSPLAIFREVLGFFIARGHLILIPLLILLLLLGLLLFFAQGSALAPMIYTLF